MKQLPPQAYTRDTLVHAYEWLKKQPGSVRELATDADSLVTLYLQSKRQKNSKPSASSIHFQKDLKELAKGLKQFEDKDILQPELPLLNFESTEASTNPCQPPQKMQTPNIQAKSVKEPDLTLQLDAQSRKLLSEVRRKFNLSHPNEALRMLLSLGYEQIKSILPKD